MLTFTSARGHEQVAENGEELRREVGMCGDGGDLGNEVWGRVDNGKGKCRVSHPEASDCKYSASQSALESSLGLMRCVHRTGGPPSQLGQLKSNLAVDLSCSFSVLVSMRNPYYWPIRLKWSVADSIEIWRTNIKRGIDQFAKKYLPYAIILRPGIDLGLYRLC